MAVYTTMALAVIGAAVSAAGMMQQGRAQQRQADFQSQMAARNAQIAEQNAQLAEEEGREAKRIGADNAQKKRLEAAGIIGAQRAAASATGAQVDQGAFLDLTLDTAEKGELDAMALYEQGQQADYGKRVEGWNLRQQATGQQMESAMLKSQSQSATPWLAAGGTLLSGLASAGSNYHGMTKGAGASKPGKSTFYETGM